jgi:hypothetical protein
LGSLSSHRPAFAHMSRPSARSGSPSSPPPCKRCTGTGPATFSAPRCWPAPAMPRPPACSPPSAHDGFARCHRWPLPRQEHCWQAHGMTPSYAPWCSRVWRLRARPCSGSARRACPYGLRRDGAYQFARRPRGETSSSDTWAGMKLDVGHPAQAAATTHHPHVGRSGCVSSSVSHRPRLRNYLRHQKASNGCRATR